MKVTGLFVTGALALSMSLLAPRVGQASERGHYDHRPAYHGDHSRSYRSYGGHYRPYYPHSYRYVRPYYYGGYAYDGPYAPYPYVPPPVYVPYRPYYGPRVVIRFGWGF